MSIQFGRWNFNAERVGPACSKAVRSLLIPYAPDGIAEQSTGSVTLLFGSFHTTKESRQEQQPGTSPKGDRILWDGRLDNRPDCILDLSIATPEPTDLEIVTAAHERWGDGALPRLIGDWALSIWSPSENRLLLARDFLGARQLYYSVVDGFVAWSTILEPLIALRDGPLKLSEEYVAGWLSEFPKSSLTPYKRIFAVPPASSVVIRQGEVAIRQFWDFDPEKRLRLRNDREYEQLFLNAFSQSVARRTRSQEPVLAELSGGMDSSSIVCVADRLTRHGLLGSPRLDTLSFYSDAEPNWDEQTYFTRVEEQRGRTGIHVGTSASESLTMGPSSNHFLATPACEDSESSQARQLSDVLASGPYRVVLSGVGGDEVTGGLPTPLPELADLLVEKRFNQFLHQLVDWSLAKRTTALRLLSLSIGMFLPYSRPQQPNWLTREFAQRNREALKGYRERLKAFGPAPSFQLNMIALDSIRRHISCIPQPCNPPYEKRFPFLDRDFLAFCYSLPREQFVRPHQRRSLLRRAMTGIVPDEILNRRRKAFVVRRLIATLARTYDSFVADRREFLCAAYGIVEPGPLLKALGDTRRGDDTKIIPIVRVIALEQWLRNLETHAIV
jgi:asparagine synthase (glutamine-hydrolysing)